MCLLTSLLLLTPLTCLLVSKLGKVGVDVGILEGMVVVVGAVVVGAVVGGHPIFPPPAPSNI